MICQCRRYLNEVCSCFLAEPVPPARRLVLRLRPGRSGQVPARGGPGGRQAIRLPGGKTTKKYPYINTNKLLFFAMNFKARGKT